jgi:hypothetical protein
LPQGITLPITSPKTGVRAICRKDYPSQWQDFSKPILCKDRVLGEAIPWMAFLSRKLDWETNGRDFVRKFHPKEGYSHANKNNKNDVKYRNYWY